MTPVGPHPRGRPARRLPERAGGHRDRRQGAADRRSSAAPACSRLEVTSFVRPDVIPQLPTPPPCWRRSTLPDDVSRERPDPQRARARQRAASMRDRFDEINVFLSASETHNRKNVNRSIDESLDGARARAGARPRGGAALRGRDHVSFGCPYEGLVDPERVFEIARAAGRGRRAGGRLRRHDRDGESGAGHARSSRARASARRRGRADRPLPQHARPGSGECLRGAGGGRATRSSRASASWAAARCRPARPATSLPRISSRCCTRWASQTGIDLPALIAALAAGAPTARAAARLHTLVAGPVDWHARACTSPMFEPRPDRQPRRDRACA